MKTLARASGIAVGVAAIALAFLGYTYRHDARQLNGFYDRSAETEMKLRNLQVCLDMRTHPERWQGTSLKPPCDLDANALRDLIPEYESAVNDWNRTIRDRETLINERRKGPFRFVERMAE